MELGRCAARLVEGDEIGECAPRVNADEPVRHANRSLKHSRLVCDRFQCEENSQYLTSEGELGVWVTEGPYPTEESHESGPAHYPLRGAWSPARPRNLHRARISAEQT
jgi:hypothetical protein